MVSPALKAAPFRQEQVSYTDSGKGRAVVLVHGFLGSSAIWQPTIAALSSTYRVICVDLPGHGKTPCFGYVHSMELMAKAVKAVLDHLRLKKYVMIGHSMGGYVTLAFAEMFPDHLVGLGLFHSTPYPDSEEKKNDRLRAMNAVRANRRIYTTSTIRHLFATKNLKYLKQEVAFANSVASTASRRGITAALLGMRDRPSREMVLLMLNYPVFMAIGELDNMLAPEPLLALSKEIRECQVLYLEHDGHFGFLESPITTRKALRKFLRGCFRARR